MKFRLICVQYDSHWTKLRDRKSQERNEILDTFCVRFGIPLVLLVGIIDKCAIVIVALLEITIKNKFIEFLGGRFYIDI